MYDIIVIGSGPAGLSAAIYAKRANLSVAVIEKDYQGKGQIVESGQVDNYLGFPGISGYDLGEKFREHALKLGVEFIEREVTAIVPVRQNGKEQFEVHMSGENVSVAKSMIYAAGASPRKAEIPGEDTFAGMGVSYCATCDGNFFKDRTVAVLGGGDTALDDALYLSGLAKQVYLIHRRDTFRGAANTVELLKGKENVTFLLKEQVIEVVGDIAVTGVILSDGKRLPVDGVFIAYGSVPQTALIQNLVELDERGYVIAGEDGETNQRGFYVAGDVRTKNLRQVVTAVADGANAATMAAEFLRSTAD